jgi:hypothetical protein
MENLVSGLERLGKVAKQDKQLQFNNLMHHITPALFHEAYKKLNLQAAKGVDNLSWQDYAKACEQRLTILHEQLQSGKYKPKQVKRQWLPKGSGEQRPIGITSLQDKIIQQMLVLVLEPIYDAEFLGFSYGFRQLVKKVLTGYYNYFAIPGNHTSLQMMRTEVARAWIKAMRRRSQKGRIFNWF